MLQNYIKIAWRNLLKNPLYSIINISGLALGIGICMLITLFVKDELSFDQFYNKKNDIYRLVVEEKNPDGTINKFGQTGMTHGPAFKQQIPAIKNMVRFNNDNTIVKINNEVIRQNAYLVDSTIFNIFDFTFVEGTKYKALTGLQSVVISQAVAKKYFGNDKALGKSMNINFDGEFQEFIISGVIEDAPQNSSIQAEMLLPLHKSKNQDNLWINFYLNTFFEIESGADIANIEKQFENIFASDAREQIAQAKKEFDFKSEIHFKLQPFLEMHLSRDYKASSGLKESGNVNFSYFLSAIALFILVIACINFINLSIARSEQRSKEIGVRKVSGSSQKQLILQFMSESFIMNGLAFLLGSLFVVLALPFFNHISSKQLAFHYLFDIKLILIFLLLFCLTGLMAGFYPAIILSKFKPVETLYKRFKLASKNTLQNSLIVFQFFLASFFILFAIVQYRQTQLFTDKDLGYDDKNLVEIESSFLTLSKKEVVVNELKKDPSIIGITTKNGNWYTGVKTSEGTEVSPYMTVTDENFLSTHGLKLKEGRFFSKDFPSDTSNSALVNEAFLKNVNMKDPIGKEITVMNRDKYQIIGVVKDYHHSSLYEEVIPQVFVSNPNYGSSNFIIKIANNNVPKTLDHIRNVFKTQYPFQPYAYNFISDLNAKNYEKEYKMREMILFSALIIIFISCIGMFGLAALTTQKRTKEIGVRKIHGASIQSIVGLLSIQFFKLVLLSFAIAIPISYYSFNALLQNLPFRIPIKADMYLITLIGIIFIAFVASSYHAIKAALVNPVNFLKTE
jgi:putative ABC transport system permease protein